MIRVGVYRRALFLNISFVNLIILNHYIDHYGALLEVLFVKSMNGKSEL